MQILYKLVFIVLVLKARRKEAAVLATRAVKARW